MQTAKSYGNSFKVTKPVDQRLPNLILSILPNKTKPRLWCDITFHTLILTLRYIIVCTCWVIHQTQADLEKVEVVYRTLTPIRQG